jgi:hypothetical protein
MVCSRGQSICIHGVDGGVEGAEETAGGEKRKRVENGVDKS